MVIKAMHVSELDQPVAIKVFIGDGIFEYLKESWINQKLIDHPNILKAVKSVGTEDLIAPLKINGQIFENYSYIVMPYLPNGSLLKFIR